MLLDWLFVFDQSDLNFGSFWFEGNASGSDLKLAVQPTVDKNG